MSVLREADLVASVRRGNTITYSINTSVVEDAASILLELVQQSVEETRHGANRTES